MPARLIRDGLLDSERVCKLPLEARWLFVTICLCADDVGIFDAAPFALMRKAELQRDLGPQLLGLLADADLIRLYEVDGKRYGFIPRYGQRLRLRRIKHPLPPASLFADDREASSKIKDLTSGMPAHCSKVRPEAEAEAEAEKRTKPSSKVSSVAPVKPARPKASKRCPDSWVVSQELRDWGAASCPGLKLGVETASFRDHTFATSRTDWDATWRNWMRKAHKSLAPSVGGSFRQRDAAAAAAEVAAWTGGRIVAKSHAPDPDNIIDMEPTHGRLNRD